MSKLDELILKYCPNGVEYKTIGSRLEYEQPSKYIVSSTEYKDEYLTPVLTAGQTYILGYTDETDGIYPASKENPCIIFDDFTAAFKWVDFPFKVKSSAMKILTANSVDELRYVYHCMGNLNYSSDEHKRLWISTYSLFEIPVPPLPVQEEIVRILDKFTELQANLADELTARKQQYDYYRDELLTFGDEVEILPLSRVFSSIRNGFVGTVVGNFSDADNGVRYLEGKNIHNGHISNNDCVYVTHEFDEKHKNGRLEAGAIVMVQSGHVGESAVVTKELENSNCHALIIMDGIDSAKYDSFFINYYFQSSEGKYKLSKLITGGTIKHINSSKMKDFDMPMPPLPVQQKIVALLDRFDALCNDITAGLPAEIEARQQQYEYYRDKLLTFKRKDVAV